MNEKEKARQLLAEAEREERLDERKAKIETAFWILGSVVWMATALWLIFC